jgi:glycosyltransferase involved in cell wall biosynthesis
MASPAGGPHRGAGVGGKARVLSAKSAGRAHKEMPSRRALGNRFVLVVPVCNAEALVEACLASLFGQDHDDLGVVIRDDGSTDRTAEIVAGLLGIDGVRAQATRHAGRDVLFLRNPEKLYACGNVYRAALDLVEREDAIVGTVDGDDRLALPDAASRVERAYREDARRWLVWSQHRTSSGKPGCSAPLPPDEVVGATRAYWSVSHFRTARAWLYRHVREADLRDLDDPQSYMKLAGDAALVFPMAEMARSAHSYFLDEPLYHYNDDLPTNELRKDAHGVERYSHAVRSTLRRYEALTAGR